MKSFVDSVKKKPRITNQDAFDFLSNCSNAIINWTIARPINSIHPVIENLKDTHRTHSLSTPKYLVGNPELIDSAKNYFSNQGIKCDERNIVIGFGIFSILQDIYKIFGIKDQNQTVLMPTPTFGMFYKQCAMDGIKTEFLHTTKENNWQISPEALDEQLSHDPSIKILLLNFPNNPTGCVMTEESAKAIAEVLKNYPDVLVICDEILVDTVLQDNFRPHSLAAIPELAERTIILNSASKSRAEGLSCAFAYFPKEIAAIYQANPDMIMPTNDDQIVAARLLINNPENQKYLAENIEQYHKNIEHLKTQIDLLNKKLNQHFGGKNVDYVKPYVENPEAGNVYLLDFSGLKEKHLVGKPNLNTGLDIAKFLLEKATIGTVPGECFFIDPKAMVIRIPTSTHQTEVKIGFEKMAQVMIENLKNPPQTSGQFSWQIKTSSSQSRL